jgi:hypothetical protein
MWIEKRDTGVAVYHTLQPGNYFILEVRKRWNQRARNQKTTSQ